MSWRGSVLIAVAVGPLLSAQTVDYNRDIRPILSDRCFARARRCADLPSAARGVAILDDVGVSAAAMLRVYRQLASGLG